MLLFSAILACCINSALSGIATTPGIQRSFVGITAIFKWSVTGPISSYSVNNQTLGYPGPLNSNADYIMDNQSGMVILIITNVQLSDAGNYSLSVTTGANTQTDASALLFLNRIPIIYVNQTFGGSGQQPVTEGDAVELTCTAISTSLPVAYRPKVIYYQWHLGWIGTLQNISSGQATLQNYMYNGDPVPGYSIKNDGRTLVIASAQYQDTQGINCYVQEQWSPNQYVSGFSLPLKYRPLINLPTPANRKFNAIVGDQVSLSFYCQANPAITSATNWSFINTAGQAQDLPFGSLSSVSYYSYSPKSLRFTLTSTAYYGNYSITLSNSIGATTETFQVLGQGPPDAPSSVMVNFVAHYLIAIAWNCMWFNGRQQTIFVQLRAMSNDSVIDSQNTTLFTDCYNSTSTTYFQNGIQPESNYEVRVWSTNHVGSSDVIRSTVKTPKIFTFNVSPNTISLNGNQATVSYSATEGKIARLDVTYCVVLTGGCGWSTYFNLNDTTGRLNFDLTQSGDVYIFDFTVYGGDSNRDIYYSLTMVRDVRVSRNRETEESVGDKANPLLIAVIVLAVLLGVAVLALIGCIIAVIVFKSRRSTQPSNSQQTRTIVSTYAPQTTTQRNNQAYEDEGAYEAVEGNPSKNEDTHYTSLEGQRHN